MDDRQNSTKDVICQSDKKPEILGFLPVVAPWEMRCVYWDCPGEGTHSVDGCDHGETSRRLQEVVSQ